MLSPQHVVPPALRHPPTKIKADNPIHFGGGPVDKRSDTLHSWNTREADAVLRDGTVSLVLYGDDRMAYRVLDITDPCELRVASSTEFFLYGREHAAAGAGAGKRKAYVFRASTAQGAKPREAWVRGINDLLARCAAAPGHAAAASAAVPAPALPPCAPTGTRLAGDKRRGPEGGRGEGGEGKRPRAGGAGAGGGASSGAAAQHLPPSASTTPTSTPRLPLLPRSEVFVSYDWGPKLPDGTFKNQAKALRVVKALESKGLRVFFDYDAMAKHASITPRQGMNSAMAANIDSAAAVVVCFSETYEASNNCMKELRYADANNKYIYYVNSREQGAPSSQGELAFLRGDKLYSGNRTEAEFQGRAGFASLWEAMYTCPAIKALVDEEGGRRSCGGDAAAAGAAGAASAGASGGSAAAAASASASASASGSAAAGAASALGFLGSLLGLGGASK